MADEYGIERLFFELASESRLGILSELQTRSLRLQQIARTLDLTETETCRQLQRLSEVLLVEKKPDQKYSLTNYARLILELSSPIDFVSRNKDFFLKHNIFLLPDNLRARFGDLAACKLVNLTIDTINKVAEMVKTAQVSIDSVILGLESIDELMRQRCQEGIKVRWLIEESLIPRAPSILHAWQKLPEIRVLPMVVGHYTLTDKMAILTLRQNDGTMGFSSLFGDSASFLKWTEELFMYEWHKAKPWYP